MKSTSTIIAIVLCLSLLVFSSEPATTQVVPQMPDACLSFVHSNGADIFINDTGETLATVGAEISVIVLDGAGLPISNIPASDIYLVSCDSDGNFVFNTTLFADGPTDVGGNTTISGSICGRGWSDSFAVVAMGTVLICNNQESDCLPIRVRSKDIDADGDFDLQDAAQVIYNYPPNVYEPQADLNFDGVINLSDLTILAPPQWAGAVAPSCQ